MPYGSGADRETRYQIESTFGTLPAAWSSGTPFECEEYGVEGLQRANLENNNMRQRPLATRQKVLSLANGTIGFKVPMHGRRTAVADDARATMSTPREPIADFMQCAWGGVRLGYRTIIASGSAAAPVVEAGDGVQYEAGDWIWAIDVSADATRAYARKILSISTDTLTFFGGHDLPFTPAASDILAASISFFPYSAALTNPRHASHTTLSFLDFGELADDARQCLGTKINLTGVEGLAPGEAGKMVFEGMVTQLDNDAVTPPSAGTPLANTPIATATGDDTFVYIAAVGATLTAVEAQGFSVTPGIASQPIAQVGGLEGRAGYALAQGSADAPMLEVTVDYDDAWMTGYDAGTLYHVLIQVGTVPGDAYAWYAANCELAEDPQRTTTTDLATTTLKFRCLESAVATAATGAALERVRAKLEFIMSSALS